MTDDGRLTVHAVHYNSSIANAIEHFKACGFEGIADMRKGDPINCNEARTEVQATARRGGGQWYYQGNYDWNVGNDCRIYTFTCDVMPEDRG